MLDTTYESFANSIAMELFQSRQKKINEFNSLSDEELGKNIAYNVLNAYIDRKNKLIKKYHGNNGLFDMLDYKIDNYASKEFSVKIDDIEGNYLSVRPYMYAEILVSGEEGKRSSMKTKASGFNPIPKEPLLYGFVFDKEMNKKYSKNGLPNFIVLNPWTESLVPIYDDNIGIMCIYSKDTGNVTDFIMINRNTVLKDAHRGALKTNAEYIDYFMNKAKKK